MPSSDELDKILIEDTGTAFGGEKPEAKEFPTLIRRSVDPAVEPLPAIR